MKRWIAAALVLALCVTLFAGCAGTEQSSSQEESGPSVAESSAPEDEERAAVRVAALKGPTAMGMVKLMEENEGGSAANDYAFTIAGSADEITPKLVKGDLDIAAVPANLAAVLYQNTEGQVRVLAVNTLGVLYIVENGESIRSIQDLRGRTLYSSGKGATPEYALNYLLQENGLDPERDVTVEYKSEHTEVVAALAQDPDGAALLPQPFVTTAQMQNQGLHVALDLTQEWDKLQNGSALITGVLVVREAFAREHPEAVQAFLEEYRASTEFTNTHVEEAAALVEQYGIIKATVAQKAIPQCNITCITGEEMKEKLGGYLAVLAEQNPKSVGGALPDETFYYLG